MTTKLYSTGDWHINRTNLGLDGVFVQVYDACYALATLCGPNSPSPHELVI